MNIGEGSEREIRKDKKTVLREERVKKEKSVEVWKTRVEKKKKGREKKEKLLREVIVKIKLKQKEDKKGIVVEVLLDSSATELVMSSEFIEKNKFKTKRLEKLIYMRNIDGTFNYEKLIDHMVEVELFFKRHKEKILIGELGR